MDEYDYIVVGGGHNGLVASIVLAMHGARVLLVESRRSLGGMSSDGAYNGARYPRVAYSIGLLPGELVDYLGIGPLKGIQRPDPSWVVVSDGEVVFRWWRSSGRLRGEFESHGAWSGAREVLGAIEWFRRCSHDIIYTAEPPSLGEAAEMVDRCRRGLGELLELPWREGLGAGLPRWAWSLFTYPVHEDSPGYTTLFLNMNMGMWDQPSSMEPLIGALEGRARSLGVVIAKGVGRAVIDVEGGRAVGVRAAGRRFRARRGVLYSGNILYLPRSLDGEGVDALGRDNVRRLEGIASGLHPPLRLNVVTTKRPEPPVPWRPAPLIEIWGRGYWIEVSYPTLEEPARGVHAVTISGYAPVDRMEDALSDAGVDSAVFIDEVGPYTLEAEYRSPGGHPNHVPMTRDHILDKRPLEGWSNYTTPIEGLYHGSASSHPGGQITGIPGYNAAIKMLLDAGLRPRVIKKG